MGCCPLTSTLDGPRTRIIITSTVTELTHPQRAHPTPFIAIVSAVAVTERVVSEVVSSHSSDSTVGALHVFWPPNTLWQRLVCDGA
jgi:hypothetical protein